MSHRLSGPGESNRRNRRVRKQRLELEALEGRCLLATFTPYPITTGPQPTAITADSSGSLWFAQPGSSSPSPTPGYIGRITTSGTISEFTLPSGYGVQALTAGGDGNIWFTDPSTLAIGKITGDGQIQEFKLPDPSTVNNRNGIDGVNGITEGPDGNVWFTGTTYGGGAFSSSGNVGIGKITPAGQITEYAVSDTTLGLFGSLQLITKAGNSLAFINSDYAALGSNGSELGRITTSGTATLFPFPFGSGKRQISGITGDTQGNLWFLEVVTTGGFISGGTSQLELGELNTAGQIIERPLISSFPGLTSGGGIAVGGDGNLYFTANDQIGEVILTTGNVTFNQVATLNAGSLTSQSQDITKGPDGFIWYTQQSPAAIVKSNVGGTTTPTPTPTPTPTSTLRSIALTPANPSVAIGASQQFNATGTYSDNSVRNLNSLVTWASATPGVATISASGVANAVAAGSSVITASLNGVTATTTLTVTSTSTATLRSISLTPANPSVAVGAAQQFIATGLFSDNSTQNITTLVTWASATPGVATISASGVANAVAAGSSVITASLNGINSVTLLSVLPNIPPAPTPPSVTGIAGMTRSRKGVTTITVGFNEELNSTSATNPAFYHLALGVKKKRKLVFTQGVHVKGLAYNPGLHSVTIRLAKPTKGNIQVIVRGGILALNGAASSGNFTAVVP